jgi:hypothetical protein
MKANRRMLVALVSLVMLGAACGGGSTPQADSPEQPTDTAATPTAPSTPESATTPPANTAPATQAAPPAAAQPQAAAPAAPKPGKERIVGKWQFDFSGEPRAAAEADAKKKAGKDDKKLAELMKEIEATAGGEWIEFTAPPEAQYISHITEKGKDKVILKVKYEVTKDENGTLVMKPAGKDEVSKKDLPKDLEIPVTFKDDNTIEMKDPKKKMTLIFKRKS